jgi:hypothetical protein
MRSNSIQRCLRSFQLDVNSFQFDVDLVDIIQHLNHVIVNLDFNVMLLTHVLDKDNEIVCLMSAYSSIQFSADADLDHFVIEEQRVRVLFF